MNEKIREEKRKVTTVVEGVLVIGIGNCDSVTKKQCITELETLINVKDNTKQTQPNHWSMQKMTPTTRHWNQHWLIQMMMSTKKQVFTIASRNASKISGTVVENDVYRNLYKKFDSPHLLPRIIRKFKTKDKKLKFDKIYFDHLRNDRRKKLYETQQR